MVFPQSKFRIFLQFLGIKTDTIHLSGNVNLNEKQIAMRGNIKDTERHPFLEDENLRKRLMKYYFQQGRYDKCALLNKI